MLGQIQHCLWESWMRALDVWLASWNPAKLGAWQHDFTGFTGPVCSRVFSYTPLCCSSLFCTLRSPPCLRSVVQRFLSIFPMLKKTLSRLPTLFSQSSRGVHMLPLVFLFPRCTPSFHRPCVFGLLTPENSKPWGSSHFLQTYSPCYPNKLRKVLCF